jgi:putative membrane protein
MLWLKAFHVIFMVTWFAGLFYLPRLFVYHVVTEDAVGRARFEVMERRLLIMMNIGFTLTLIFGVAMILVAPLYYLTQHWLHVKLVLVALLIFYHAWCAQLITGFRTGRNTHSQRWYRIFNEAPSILLIAIVILVMVKPF